MNAEEELSKWMDDVGGRLLLRKLSYEVMREAWTEAFRQGLTRAAEICLKHGEKAENDHPNQDKGDSAFDAGHEILAERDRVGKDK